LQLPNKYVFADASSSSDMSPALRGMETSDPVESDELDEVEDSEDVEDASEVPEESSSPLLVR
jgi:hypothetical protein